MNLQIKNKIKHPKEGQCEEGSWKYPANKQIQNIFPKYVKKSMGKEKIAVDIVQRNVAVVKHIPPSASKADKRVRTTQSPLN